MDKEELLAIIKRPVPERFHQTMEGIEFSIAEPLTEKDLQEAEEIWNQIKGKGTTKGKRVNK